MAGNYKSNKQPGVLRSLDWWTIGIYLALLSFGWVSVCGASYTYGDTDILSLSSRSGMQIVWIGTSICLGFVLLMMDDRCLCVVAAAVVPHNFQSAFHKGLAFLDRFRSVAPAACGVCQVRNGSGYCKIHVGIWFYHLQLEASGCCCRHNLLADVVYRRAARDGFRTCLSVVLPDVLP